MSKNITSNLPYDGYEICECGWACVDGVCSNPNCPTETIYNNGYRASGKVEKYPVIEIE